MSYWLTLYLHSHVIYIQLHIYSDITIAFFLPPVQYHILLEFWLYSRRVHSYIQAFYIFHSTSSSDIIYKVACFARNTYNLACADCFAYINHSFFTSPVPPILYINQHVSPELPTISSFWSILPTVYQACLCTISPILKLGTLLLATLLPILLNKIWFNSWVSTTIVYRALVIQKIVLCGLLKLFTLLYILVLVVLSVPFVKYDYYSFSLSNPQMYSRYVGAKWC